MSRFLFFPASSYSWQDLPVQSILCGSPRYAIINPISTATSYLWEQLEPDPLVSPVTILPNNTSKDITVLLPNSISSYVLLRVTLNGRTNEPKYVTINPLLEEFIKHFNKSSSHSASIDNTLNNPVPINLAPIPSLGPTAQYINSSSSLIGIRLNSQSYRTGYTKGVTVNSTYVPFNFSLYNIPNETRTEISPNTLFTVLKDWINVKVFSQSIVPIATQVNIAYPSVIADDYISNLSKGSTIALLNRQPYSVLNLSTYDELNNVLSKSNTTTAQLTRTPYSVLNQNHLDGLVNNFTKGNTFFSFIRTPYSSNIVG